MVDAEHSRPHTDTCSQSTRQRRIDPQLSRINDFADQLLKERSGVFAD
jgi:hypothetical protein